MFVACFVIALSVFRADLGWNSSTPFTYVVNFTNITLARLFTLTVPLGIVAMPFSVLRVDHRLQQTIMI